MSELDKLLFRQKKQTLVLVCLQEAGSFKMLDGRCGMNQVGLKPNCEYLKDNKCTYSIFSGEQK